jgi:amino acid adenylation domain-containing protein
MAPSSHIPVALNPNVAWMLWDTAHERPDHPAILERAGAASYHELRARAAAFGQLLQGIGVAPGDRVAVFLERGLDAAAAFFGAAAAGAVTVIVNETLRPRQVEHILTHAAARALVTNADMLRRLPRALETTATLVMTENVPRVGEFTPIPRIGGDVAQIIYTSGSTGLPKGVTIAHTNLWAGMRSVTSYVGVNSADRIASLLPFSFDYGFNQLLCAVGTGATLVIERSPVPQQVVATLRALAVTVLPCVPPLWLQLLNVPDFCATPLSGLRAMTNTGGRLPTEAVRKLRAAHPAARLFLMYGLTEAFRATYLDPDEVDEHPDSIGRSIPGDEIMVLREDLTLCEPGEIGELVQRGATVAMGYWNDPEMTAKVFRPHPRRPQGAPDNERVVFSGDLVRIDEEGRLYFVGRSDKMIKTLGFRVSPDEIVDVLYASGEIVEGIVGTEPDPVRGDRIIAYVVLGAGKSLERLESFCRAELPRYMQPSRIDALESIPRTSSGKHDVNALRARPVPA